MSGSSENTESMGKTAFILGASGAVGKKLVQVLASDPRFSRVVSVVRRQLDGLPEKVEQRIVNFDSIEEYGEAFKDCDVGFCALGTTKAKSGAEGFYKVDHDYVVNSAKVAKNNGTKEFVLCSSTGSNEKSFFLYPKTKGETERDVGLLEFDKFVIVKPGFLDQRDNDFRLGECVAKIFTKPLSLVSNSIAITTDDVAKAMVKSVLCDDLKGKVVWENAKLLEEAKKYSGQTN